MFEDVDDEELVRRLEALVHEQREGDCEVLDHLGEFDRRRLAEPKGFPSTFEYCRTRLKFTESEAYFRISAARCLRDFESIRPLVVSGELSLTAVSMIRPYLSNSNLAEILPRAARKSRLELEVLVAELRSKQTASERASAPPELALTGAQPSFVATEAQTEPRPPAEQPVIVAAPVIRPRDSIRVLAPEVFEIGFSCSKQVVDGLKRARDVLGHKFPFGRFEEIIGLALEDLLDQRDPDRIFARKERRRAARLGARKGGPKKPGPKTL